MLVEQAGGALGQHAEPLQVRKLARQRVVILDNRLVQLGGTIEILLPHPVTFDDEITEPELRLRFPYFGRHPLRWEEKGSYAVPDADFEGVSYSWQHTFEEIVSSLAEAGLVIVSLREYPYLAWQWFSWMVKGDDGCYRLPEGLPEIPLMFSLRAAKPMSSAALAPPQ